MNGIELLIEIAGWSGPSFLAANERLIGITFYEELLIKLNNAIVRSSLTMRSSASFTVLNDRNAASGQTFGAAILADPIENKVVTIKTFDQVTSVIQTIFVGRVRRRDINEQQVLIELVDLRKFASRKLGKKVSTIDFPLARKSDAGKDVAVNVGDVENTRPQVVEDLIQSKLDIEIDRAAAQVVLESVDGFTVGFCFIGRERVQVTSVTALTKTLDITRTNPVEHAEGEIVFMDRTFTIAIDSSGVVGTGISNVRIELNDEQEILLPSPPLQAIVSGLFLGQWLTPPIGREVKGDRDLVAVEFDTAVGSADNPLNAAGRSPSYTEANSADFLGALQRTLTLSTSLDQKDKGRIHKVLIQIDHSGNKSGFDVGGSIVRAAVPGPLPIIGALAPTDQIDPDFLEIGEKKGRRAVDVQAPPAPTTGETLLFGNVTANNSGLIGNDSRIDPADVPALNDGDLNTSVFSSISLSLPPAISCGRLDYFGPIIPASIDPAATLQGVRFKFKHGGGTELPGSIARIQVIDNLLALIVGPGIFASSGAIATEVATIDGTTPWLINGGAGRTVADLQNIICQIEGIEDGPWNFFEGWLEIDYTQANPTETAGSVINQFDVTSQVLDWDDLRGYIVQIDKPAGTNEFLVYHASLVVVYDPDQDVLPDKIVADYGSGIQGTPAGIINTLWTAPTLGNNPASTIDAAALANAIARQTALGFIPSQISGSFRNLELFDIVEAISRQSRLRAVYDAGVLFLVFLEVESNNPASGVIVTREDIYSPLPTLRGVDAESSIVNAYDVRFKATDKDGFEDSFELSVPPVSSERRQNLDLPILKDGNLAKEVGDFLLERTGSRYENISFEVLRTFSALSLLQIVSLDFGFVTLSKFEIQVLILNHNDNNKETITVKGRTI